MDVEAYIAAVKVEQAATALNGLLHPPARDAYQLGHLCGYTQGLERALVLLSDNQERADGKPKPGPAKIRNPYLELLDDAPPLPEQITTQQRVKK